MNDEIVIEVGELNSLSLWEAVREARHTSSGVVRLAPGTHVVEEPLALQDFVGRSPKQPTGPTIIGTNATIAGVGAGMTPARVERVSDLTFRDLRTDGIGFLAKAGPDTDTSDLTFDRVTLVDPGFYGFGWQTGVHERHNYFNCRVIRPLSDGWDFKNRFSQNRDITLHRCFVASPGMEAGHDSAGFDIRGENVLVYNSTAWLTNSRTTGFRARRGEETDPHGLGGHGAEFNGCRAFARLGMVDMIGFMSRAGNAKFFNCTAEGMWVGAYADVYNDRSGFYLSNFVARMCDIGVRVSRGGATIQGLFVSAADIGLEVFREQHVDAQDVVYESVEQLEHILPGAGVVFDGRLVI